MTLRARVLSNEESTQTKQWTWTVTLRDTSGATKSRQFNVTYTPEAIRPDSRHPNGWYWPTGTGDTGGYLGWLKYNSEFKGWHLGQDFISKVGTPVYAIADGTVLLSRTDVNGYGRDGQPGGALVLLHQTSTGQKFKALYGHVDEPRSQGETVRAGDMVAYINNHNIAHLHFGIHPGEELPDNPWKGYTDDSTITYGWEDPLLFLDSNQATASSSCVKLNVPYIHQVYDTADDFIGCWACAPTSAVMVLAYHGLVGKDPIQISSISYGSEPPAHTSDYGKYISREYQYGNTIFSTESKEYISNIGWAKGKGAWGYIWSDSLNGVASNLQSYLEHHDLEVEYISSPTAEQSKRIVISEIDENSPLIARTYLTDGGHYAVITGYEVDSNGEIKYYVNDPYGKKGNYRNNYGTYTNEIAQPVKYSYSDMGLGEASRGLFKITPRLSTSTEPSVSTGQTTSIDSSSALLNGHLSSMGGASSCTVCFQYGTTTSYGSTTSSQAKGSTGPFSQSISNLSPGTTYHCRAVASNSAGVVYGDDMTFTTNTPVLPATDFTANTTAGLVPLTVQFTDTSAGDPFEWFWDFGDSVTSTEQNPIHTYTAPGTYTVNHTVRNDDGTDSEEKSNYITVTAKTLPVAQFTATPTSGKAPLTVQFTDTSTGEVTTRSWFFGDGATSTEQNPIHTYTTPGNYTVSLTATNAGGSNIETRVDYITVMAPPPVANFTTNTTAGTAPLTVQFNDTSTGEVITRSWSFGDGNTSTKQNPTHTYTAPGNYTVNLTVSAPTGSNTLSRPDYITVTRVKGDFNGNGEVDIGDVSKVAYMVVGKESADPTADFNGNDRIDIGDAAKIAYYFVGKIGEL